MWCVYSVALRLWSKLLGPNPTIAQSIDSARNVGMLAPIFKAINELINMQRHKSYARLAIQPITVSREGLQTSCPMQVIWAISVGWGRRRQWYVMRTSSDPDALQIQCQLTENISDAHYIFWTSTSLDYAHMHCCWMHGLSGTLYH